MTAKLQSLQQAGMAKLQAAARHELMTFQALFHSTVSSAPYEQAEHLAAIGHALDRATSGEVRRLIISMPPRCFKSASTSVAFPTYLLGRDPSLKIICASYGQNLAHQFAHQSRLIMQSPLYAQVFPQARLRSKTPSLELMHTTQHGYRMATSVGGVLTGMGADVAIVDDPLKADDANSKLARDAVYDWFSSSLMTRFDKPAEARVVVTMQRLHQDDLVGRLKGQPGWTVLELPAVTRTPYVLKMGRWGQQQMEPGDLLFPSRLSHDALEERRATLGEKAFSAQYLQQPVPAGGLLFDLAKIRRFSPPPRAAWGKTYDAVVLSADTASVVSATADYTALTWWGIKGAQMHLLHAERGRWTAPSTIQRIRAYGADVDHLIIEAVGTGLTVYQSVAATLGTKVSAYKPKVDKVSRAEFVLTLMECGLVRLPQSALWLEPLEAELAEFPAGAHDDYVDSISQFVVNHPLLRARLHLPAVGLVPVVA